MANETNALEKTQPRMPVPAGDDSADRRDTGPKPHAGQHDFPAAGGATDEAAGETADATGSVTGTAGTAGNVNGDADGAAGETTSDTDESAGATGETAETSASVEDGPGADGLEQTARLLVSAKAEPAAATTDSAKAKASRDKTAVMPAVIPAGGAEAVPGRNASLSAPRTTPMPAPLEAPHANEVSFGDVAAAAGSYARGRRAQVGALLAQRPKTVAAIMAMMVLAVLVSVLAGMAAADMPARAAVEQEALERTAAPHYEPGPFGATAPLQASEAHVSDEYRADEDTVVATVVVSWENGSVRATANATMTYQRTEAGWEFVGVESAQAAFEATAGVDGARLVEQQALEAVLARAETSWQSAGTGTNADGTGVSSSSLPNIYKDAEVSVDDTRFDAAAQTDDATISLVRAQTFTAYKAQVSAQFAFRPGAGTWELTGASADAGAKDIGYEPLVGTWDATFVSQDTSGQGKCFAAKDVSAQVTIETATAEKVTGTLTVPAHYHGDVEADVETQEGDTEVRLPFTGERTEDASGIVYACTTTEAPGGTVGLRLAFGQTDDPTAATAEVSTTHDYEATFLLVPYTRTATFTDRFTLTKASDAAT